MPESQSERRVSHSAMVIELNQLASYGGVALRGDKVGLAQYIGVDSEGTGTIYNIEGFMLDYSGPARTVDSLQMTGVTRRRGLLRRHVECTPYDIQTGDKVVFDDGSGNKVKTLKVKSTLNEDAMRVLDRMT